MSGLGVAVRCASRGNPTLTSLGMKARFNSTPLTRPLFFLWPSLPLPSSLSPSPPYNRACLAQLLRKPPALPPPSDTSMYGRSAATAALVLWEEVRTSAAPAKAGGLKPSASQAQLPAGASSRALGSAPPADARLSPTPASLLALPAAAASAAAGGAQPADAPPAAAAANAQLQSREALLKQLASGLGGEDEEEEGAINEDGECQLQRTSTNSHRGLHVMHDCVLFLPDAWW